MFESSLGYSVIYDDTVFEYNRTGDYDEIGLRGQTFSSKPVFFEMCIRDRLIIRGLELRSKSKMFDDYQQEYPRKE